MDAEQVARLDAADELAAFRDRFLLPDASVYLDGNSLGALPSSTESAITDVLTRWRREAVAGWDAWIDIGATVGDRLAPLLGAPPGSVLISDQTSVNLYKLASAALSHSGGSSILTDAGNFPSDRYVLAGIAEAAGGRLVVIEEDPAIETIVDGIAPDVGLVALTHVGYRSGHLHDGAAITRAVHEAGALMVWDLAHSAGAVPVALEAWGAELAVGCTYKYLNGGPGSPGFLFVRPDLHDVLDQPIHGWFGHEDMFGFHDEYRPDRSIRRFQVGTPPVVAIAATAAGIDITAEAGISAIRSKGTALGDVFIDLVTPILARHGGDIASPREGSLRGSHVAIRHDEAFALSLALRDAGVVVDFRAPDVIRFGFAPLYLRFADIAASVEILDRVLGEGAHRAHVRDRFGVT